MNRFGIPVFEATIESINEGIMAIALVDSPAVESDFVAFKKEDPLMQKFTIQDDEQHMITGVVMRANRLIYRYSDDIGEYYIFYSAKTIKQMAEKMMTDNNQNNINIMHNDDQIVDGVNLVELFIKDTDKGISPDGFDDIEDGSLFATYKVNNDSIWEEIKAGTFKGLSLQGFFTINPTVEQMKSQKKLEHNIMNKIIEKYLSKLIKFNQAETDKGVIEWVGDEDLKVGDEVFQTVEGEKVKVEDGDYKIGDTTVTIKDGVVTYIDTPVEEEMQEETIETEMQEEEETIEETEEETVEDEPDQVQSLKIEVDELKQKLEELTSVVNDLLAKPAGTPIEEEYSKNETPIKIGRKINPTLKF